MILAQKQIFLGAQKTIDKNTSLITVEANTQFEVPVEPGTVYVVGELNNEQIRLIKDFVATRKGNDLIIRHLDGSLVIFTGYFLLADYQEADEPSMPVATDELANAAVVVAGEDGNMYSIASPQDSNLDGFDSSSIVYQALDDVYLQSANQLVIQLTNQSSISFEPHFLPMVTGAQVDLILMRLE